MIFISYVMRVQLVLALYNVNNDDIHPVFNLNVVMHCTRKP